MNNKLIYKHSKPNGEIFYIGIGHKKRPKSKSGRSKHWHNIVNKYGYEIEIIHENLNWELACEIEIHLIAYYGRKDLGLGNLINLTDGGDGTNGYFHKKESKIKMSLNNSKCWINRKHTLETKKLMSEHSKGIYNGNSKKVINTKTGEIYNSVREASEKNEISYPALKRRLSNITKNNTNLIYL